MSRYIAYRGADATGSDIPVSVAKPLPVALQEAAGSITWAAPVAVGMTGSSKTFVPADATRKALLLESARRMPSRRAPGTVTSGDKGP